MYVRLHTVYLFRDSVTRQIAKVGCYIVSIAPQTVPLLF